MKQQIPQTVSAKTSCCHFGAPIAVGFGLIAAASYFFLQARVDINYQLGRGFHPWYGFLFGFPFQFLLPVALFGLVAAIVLSVCNRFFVLDLSVVLVGAATVLFYTFNPIHERPPYLSFMHGFRDQLNERVDPVALERWVSEVVATNRSETAVITLKDYEVPAYLLSLREDETPTVDLVKPDKCSPHIEVTYGGGFVHWGLVIADVRTIGQMNVHYIDWTNRISVFYSR